MVKVVLFDLDGTLLPHDTDIFLSDYTKAIGAKVGHITESTSFVRNLLYATNKMLEDKNPNVTNKEVFWAHFLDNVSVPRDLLIPLLDEFYEKDFPLLGTGIKIDNTIPDLIKKLKERGYRMVLATNAVFPKVAVVERMRWALLEPNDFELITTYENMHFCKPHLEYYEEIVTYLDEQPGHCMMVGNDIEEDMIAGKLGIKTFLLDPHIINRGNSSIPYDYRGNLESLSKILCP